MGRAVRLKFGRNVTTGLLLGLLVASLVGSMVGCKSRNRKGQDAPPPPEIAKVETRDLEVKVEAAGAVEPLLIVEVKSRVGGELQRIAVETGEEVARGAVLAEIDPRDVRNALAQAEADLEVSKARVATTEAQARRADELFSRGVIPAQDQETTALTATNARAERLKAETNLELARQRMGDVTIRAPIAGTVIAKTVEQGQIIASASGNVSGGTTLLQMADLATMQVRAMVDEVDIGRVIVGQSAEVTVEAYPGRVFRGEVAKIEPQAVIEQNVTMFPVLVRLANPERLLKPGMNAEVAVGIAERRGVAAVPNSAVVAPREVVASAAILGLDAKLVRAQADDSEKASLANNTNASGAAPGRPGVVFVQGANGPEARYVQLGLSDWDFTEVISGLEPGTPVILLSVARMQQQQRQFTQRMRQSTGMFGGSSGGSSGGGAPQGAGGGGRPAGGN